MDPISAGNRVLAEPSSAGDVQVAYVYGASGMLSQLSGNGTYTYFENLQGSIVAVADSTGAIRNSYRYDPFGQKLPSSREQVANLFGFLGRFSVPSLGPYSLTAFRVYDARAGRFNGVDPAAYMIDVSTSPFVYARQSPFRFVDPSGLCSLRGFFQATSDCYSFADNPSAVAAATAYTQLAKTTGYTALGVGQSLVASGAYAGGQIVGGTSSTIGALESFNSAFANAGAAGANIAAAIKGTSLVSANSIETPFETIGNAVPGLNSAASVVTTVNDLYGIFEFFRVGGSLSNLRSGVTLQQIRAALNPSLLIQNPSLLNAFRAAEGSKGLSDLLSLLDIASLPDTINGLVSIGASGGNGVGNPSGTRK